MHSLHTPTHNDEAKEFGTDSVEFNSITDTQFSEKDKAKQTWAI